MITRKIFLALMLAAVLTGCSRHPEPRHIVILVDVSGSIDRDSLMQAFKAIDDFIGHLQRGDRIVIIPILGDAQTEASGRIIRFDVPMNRQAYDGDLRGFRTRLKASLEEMKSAAIAHPGSKTDILGSIALAEQEFHSAYGPSERLLVVLSDFIQEDREIDFRRDKRLEKQASAKHFATQVVKTDPLNFDGAPICLGLLRSAEYVRLGRQRRDAIREFWLEYFKSLDARPKSITDGIGLMERSKAEK
jgi:hypothetical protein